MSEANYKFIRDIHSTHSTHRNAFQPEFHPVSDLLLQPIVI